MSVGFGILGPIGGQEKWYPTRHQYNGKHGPNNRLGDNRPLHGWNGQLYEGGIRVPAVLCWPRRLDSRKVTDVISVQDIFPTLAYLIGAPVIADMAIEGINVWPSITGKSAKKERILYWRTREQLALRKDDWKLVHHGESAEEGSDELFNIADDPYEKQDLAKDHVDKLLQLGEELDRQLAID